MGAAAKLADWGTARRIGVTFSGEGPIIAPVDRARLSEDFAEAVSRADALVADLTGLAIDGPATRPWVMTRDEWVRQNVRGFETLLDPVADRLTSGGDGPMAAVRRKFLAAQVGGLLGYLSRRVLGQYDLFLPPDDRDLLYFVGPNVISVERRHRLQPEEFRLWLSLHEVTHRFQFDGVPWLRGYLRGLVDEYVESLDLDPRRLLEAFRRAREEAARSPAWRGVGILFLLMTPEQRDTFRRMQALMSLLEGHGNHVMHVLSEGRIRGAPRFERVLRERRRSAGAGRAFQRAIGFDAKVRQYGEGERFIAAVVERAGKEGFNRVWDGPERLPTLEEVTDPEAWVRRVV
ncbi:MAG TPA: zinc-dependent metalloprotease [Actinomycetota bacterium]